MTVRLNKKYDKVRDKLLRSAMCAIRVKNNHKNMYGYDRAELLICNEVWISLTTAVKRELRKLRKNGTIQDTKSVTSNRKHKTQVKNNGA